MMILIANALVLVLAIYLGVGFVFSILFVLIGAGKIDSSAKDSTPGFRLIIIPGAAALWPLLAWRWLKGVSEPPEEKNPHRMATQQNNTFKTAEEKK